MMLGLPYLFALMSFVLMRIVVFLKGVQMKLSFCSRGYTEIQECSGCT